jgi:hypothetical protein
MEHCSYKGSYFFIHQFYVGYILFSLFPFYRFSASFIFLLSYCTSYMEKFFLASGYHSFAYFYYVWLVEYYLHPETIGIPSADSHIFQIFAVVACNQIWFLCNKAFHEGLVPNALSIPSAVNQASRTHFSTWTNKSILAKQAWKKPEPDCFKINYDTSIRINFSTQAAVWRDSNGAIIQCITKISPPRTPLYGEATTTLLAAQLCLSMQLSHVIFKDDSLTINLAINNPTITQHWRISSIISDFTSAIPPSTSWSASNINRSSNFYAHHVVNWAATRFSSSYILTSSLSLLSATIPPCFGMDF